MLGSLQGLSATKKEAQNQCTFLKQQLKTSQLQNQVLSKEVETAADFLLEQEQKVLETEKLRS